MAMAERFSASEEEEEDGAVWDDWTEDESIVNEAGNVDYEAETQVKCLLCSSTRPSSYIVLEHCSLEHGLDFVRLRQEAKLDFYDSLRLLNFIRSMVAEKRCWNCCVQCESDQSLVEHLDGAKHSSLPVSVVWKDDKYLTPFLENDPLLYEFEDDRDEEPEEYPVVDKSEIINELASVASTCDGEGLKELIDEMQKLATNNSKAAEQPLSEDEEQIAGSSRTNDAVKKTSKVKFGKVAEKEILRINNNYFSSYGEYGIHREMLGDKVRTEAYQKALMNNPFLLKDATVLDIGCGTGILSLFAAKAGAQKVVAVDGSQKMVSVARQVAKDNGYLADDGNKGIKVIGGMIEELDSKLPLEPNSADIIVSEWMGYCLLYESMLGSVLHARDRWLKPGGAMLPDIAEMHMAGFGKGGTSLAFWDDVYGFSMKHIGTELLLAAADYPIIDVIGKKDIVTEPYMIKTFDLVTMKPDDVDFNSTFELGPNFSGSTDWCYGVVIWFDTAFTSRFCKDEPVLLSTSPFSTSTHWAQTILTFKEPVALSKGDKHGNGVVGSEAFPAALLRGRVSIARTRKHRSIDVSLETTAVASNGTTRVLPVQIFEI